MNWDEFVFRAEDPCDQVEEFFDYLVEYDELAKAKTALSRAGFQDIESEKQEDEEVDPAFQKPKYRVTAWRLVCACKRKLDYLKCSPH